MYITSRPCDKNVSENIREELENMPLGYIISTPHGLYTRIMFGWIYYEDDRLITIGVFIPLNK